VRHRAPARCSRMSVLQPRAPGRGGRRSSPLMGRGAASGWPLPTRAIGTGRVGQTSLPRLAVKGRPGRGRRRYFLIYLPAPYLLAVPGRGSSDWGDDDGGSTTWADPPAHAVDCSDRRCEAYGTPTHHRCPTAVRGRARRIPAWQRGSDAGVGHWLRAESRGQQPSPPRRCRRRRAVEARGERRPTWW
jgi:hypothetical protein